MKKVVIVDGCRIPFQKSGTGYKDLLAYQLAQIDVYKRQPDDTLKSLYLLVVVCFLLSRMFRLVVG